MDDGGHGLRPTLRIISGSATPEEIAAVLAVIAARARTLAAERTEPATASTWGVPEQARRNVLPRLQASRHGWRTSYWPR